MKTFKDLRFRDRRIDPKEKAIYQQALMFFPNGYGVSVLFGTLAYSNGIDTYELFVLKGDENGWDLAHDIPITDDVLVYLTKKEVTQAMIEVQQLKPISKDNEDKNLSSGD